MPNTTNYSFPTPADTDLVKNGADAIRDLGDAVDTAMNTALGTKKAGMVLLNTTSFSGVASQSINDVFSATYENYVVFLIMQTSSTSDLQFRWRVSGADNTSAVYNYQIAGLTTSNTASNLVGTTQTLNKFSAGFNSTKTATQLNFYTPFASERSFFTSNSVGVDSGALGTTFTGSGQFTNTTSFTGFTLYAAAGNITGTVRVYGMSN
jgi:hypothetical protein